MFKVKYLAVELDDEDGGVNDTGSCKDTPEEAWEEVSHCFLESETLICEVRPVFKVEVPKTKVRFKPIKP